MSSPKPQILYYSFNGMGEDLGKSQVLEYLLMLSNKNKIDLISFEKNISREEIHEIEKLIGGRINWHRLEYSNKYKSFSTVKSLLDGLKLGKRICKSKKVDIIHCRSMLPSILGLKLKKQFGAKLIFDIRGFATDEKVDRGRIKENGLIYKFLINWEHKLYNEADHIVTLTYKAKEILVDMYSRLTNNLVTVIPTCASKETFYKVDPSIRSSLRKKHGFNEDDIIFVHTGNVGTWYDFDKEVLLIKSLQERNEKIKFLVVNKGQHAFINETIAKHNIDQTRFKLTQSKFSEVYEFLNIADYSLFFIKPSFSKQASAPTKFAENIRCELPSISNSNVGDMQRFLNDYSTGVCINLDNFSDNIEKHTKMVLEDIKNYESNYTKENFERLFKEEFDKELAVKKYQRIYENLSN